MNAWIETAGGKKYPFEATCNFGRSPNSTVVLTSNGASRRHAHIHKQVADQKVEHWLVDLGSTNGTLCNGKRVVIPVRLRDRDVLNLAGEEFVFRLDYQTASPFAESEAALTMPYRSLRTCWLLMLDVKGYTRLATQLKVEELSLLVGTWLRQARDAIESHGGVVDKFLGDAIFAYWPEQPGATQAVKAAVDQLRVLQSARSPDFRIVLHLGGCTLAGGAGGADNLSGPSVIYTFRMEKVSSVNKTDIIISRPAADGLKALLPVEKLGEFPLDGFDGKHEMFQLSRGSAPPDLSPEATTDPGTNFR